MSEVVTDKELRFGCCLGRAVWEDVRHRCIILALVIEDGVPRWECISSDTQDPNPDVVRELVAGLHRQAVALVIEAAVSSKWFPNYLRNDRDVLLATAMTDGRQITLCWTIDRSTDPPSLSEQPLVREFTNGRLTAMFDNGALRDGSPGSERSEVSRAFGLTR